MKDNRAQRIHRKNLVRKKRVTEKIKLKKKQVNQALENLDKVEAERRKAIQDFLVEKWFTPQELQESDKWKVFFKKWRTLYKLEKINYTEDIKKQLWQDLSKFAGVYGISDTKTEKKGMIFQVTYNPDTKKFWAISLLERYE